MAVLEGAAEARLSGTSGWEASARASAPDTDMRSIAWLDLRVVAATILATAALTLAHLELSFGFRASGLLGIVLVVALLAALVALGVAVSRRSGGAIVVASYAILGIVCSIILGSSIARAQRRHSFQRGDSIATALTAFHDEAHHYPGSLSELVPRHLEAVPARAMGVFRRMEFQYSLEPSSGDYLLAFEAPVWTVCHRTASSAGWACDD